MGSEKNSYLNCARNSEMYLRGHGSQTTYFYDRCPVCNRNSLTSRNVRRIRVDLVWCRKCYNRYYPILNKIRENGRQADLVRATISELENFEGWAKKERVIAIVDVLGVSREKAEKSLERLLKESLIYSSKEGIYLLATKE